MKELLTRNEIVCSDSANATSIVNSLISEGYVVMVSLEDNLWILNYIWTDGADRNEVVFVSREELEAGGE